MILSFPALPVTRSGLHTLLRNCRHHVDIDDEAAAAAILANLEALLGELDDLAGCFRGSHIAQVEADGLVAYIPNPTPILSVSDGGAAH